MRHLYNNHALIETSALYALVNTKDKYHVEIKERFSLIESSYLWHVLNVTSHELYTLSRYKSHDAGTAIGHYAYSRRDLFRIIDFENQDEEEALLLLKKYADHDISFHDALCASVMKRVGLIGVLSTDSHFQYMGFKFLRYDN